MKKKVILLCMTFFLMAFVARAEKGLKVFISVDMEGVGGVIHWEDVSRKGKDYSLFRRLMTDETNAAVEGALEAGATEILVRDSHGSARNILPDQLHPEAILLRDWSGGLLSMMEGIDETYDAVILVGHHAREGTNDLYTCLESRSSRSIESCRQIEINPLLRIAESNIDFDR